MYHLSLVLTHFCEVERFVAELYTESKTEHLSAVHYYGFYSRRIFNHCASDVDPRRTDKPNFSKI